MAITKVKETKENLQKGQHCNLNHAGGLISHSGQGMSVILNLQIA